MDGNLLTITIVFIIFIAVVVLMAVFFMSQPKSNKNTPSTGVGAQTTNTQSQPAGDVIISTQSTASVTPDPTPLNNDQVQTAPPVSTVPVTSTPATLAPLIPVVPKYMGCYADSSWAGSGKNRVFPVHSGVVNLAKCNEIAKKVGSTLFGMQFYEDGSENPNMGTNYDTAQCWVNDPNKLPNPYDRDGKLTDASCPILGTANYRRGGPWVNAVYSTV